MQRLITFGTYGIIAAVGWMFMQGGGSRPAQQTGAPQYRQTPYQQAQYQPLPQQNATPTPVVQQRPQNQPSPQAGPTIRIASFNIQVFGLKKEQNQPVMQTLAAIIGHFDVIAIQEIRTKDEYLIQRFLGNYLNPQSGRSYDYILGPRLGNTVSKEQYAYIFDTNTVEVNRNHVYTVRDPDNLLHREPLVTMFRARGPRPEQAFTFILANVHTDPDEVDTEINDLAKVYDAVWSASGGEDDLIMLGDFNADERNLGQLGSIPGIKPLIKGVYTNTRQTAAYDNLLIHTLSTAEYTGRAGVYDIQRQHNLQLDQALKVSDHLPVWAEFSVYESAAPGRVAGLPNQRN